MCVPFNTCNILSVVPVAEQDGDGNLFNYRKLTSTLFDVFCLQGEKGDIGNVGKIGPQVSCFHLVMYRTDIN